MATRPTCAIAQPEPPSPQRRAKRERQAESGRARPPKRQELSEQNLTLLQETQTPAPPGSVESSPSVISAAASDSTEATVCSSGINAAYDVPPSATPQVEIHANLPNNIQAAVNAVINARPPQERRDQLHDISRAFHDACRRQTRVGAGHDDFVRLFYTALREMTATSPCLRENSDWKEDLLWARRPLHNNLDFVALFELVDDGQEQAVDGGQEQAVDGDQEQAVDGDQEQAVDGDQEQAVDGDQEQAVDSDQSVDDASLQISPMSPPSFNDVEVSSMSSIADTSYSAPSNGLQDPSTTLPACHSPHSVSISLSSLDLSRPPTSPLTSRNLNVRGTKMFLDQLNMGIQEHNICGEARVPIPAPPASNLAFPFAAFEDKRYSTGRRAFADYALKMQLELDDLSQSPENQPQLYFRIRAEGPIYELWLHWTSREDGVPKSGMEIVRVCRGGVWDGVEGFFVAVDNVLHWGVDQFANSVAERLETIGKMVSACST